MTLQEAIDAVQRIHDEANTAHPMPADSWKDREGWQRHMDAGEKAVQRLVSEHGAKFRYTPPDGHQLRLAGVNTSCTSGTGA